MSFTLAIWTGPKPSSDAEAGSTFEALYARYVDGSEKTAPAPELVAFHDALLAKYPDLTCDDDAPWSDGPLINNITGPLFYLGIVWSRAEEVSSYIVDLASKRNLIVFDPQSGSLAS